MDLTQLNTELLTCRRCPRLVAWREQVAREKRRAYQNQEYWGKPVPGFGDPRARVFVVGLAPGAHGSNRTGRMFTGDASGDFLYPALFRTGFASQPTSHSLRDGLVLKDIFITAICRCVPPGNRPLPDEIRNCLPYLEAEIDLLKNLDGIVALGNYAYQAVIHLLKQKEDRGSPPQFGHGIFYQPSGQSPWLLSSYHPSRQNTQTGRLTTDMFDRIWDIVREKLDK